MRHSAGYEANHKAGKDTNGRRVDLEGLGGIPLGLDLICDLLQAVELCGLETSEHGAGMRLTK